MSADSLIKEKPLAIVAASGGIDSCVAAAMGAIDYRLAFLHVNYGHKTQAKELEAFHAIANFFNIDQRFVADMDHIRKIGGSSLTDKNIRVDESGVSDGEIPTSYVPFRNANILSVAVSWAEIINANVIFTGMMEEDSSGYPDCSAEFIEAFNKMAMVGTKPDTHIKVIAPLLDASKAEVVAIGVKLGAPLDLTWSCYQFEDEACGVCESCRIRLKGFKSTGIEDPIPYKTIPEISDE